jgi:prepilin-type N-terminal cleavage/methylation domain-containing protein
MSRGIPFHTARGAFTLIELLCVISLIAILAGFLFPVMQDIMTHAYDTKCASNLRQIGVAANAAANDNDNTYPIIETDADQSLVSDALSLNVPAQNLDVALAPYGVTPLILQCPIDFRKGAQSDYNTHNPHSSYMWLPTAEDNSMNTPQYISRRRGQTTIPLSKLQLASDWNPEHIPNDMSLSQSLSMPKMMYVLYGDGHIRTGNKRYKGH